MSVKFKKLIQQLHLWLGLFSGAVVFILGVTGCIYAFSDEIKQVVYADRLFIKPEKTPKLPFSVLLATAQQTVGADRPILRAQLFNVPDRTYMFRAIKVNKEAYGYWNYYEYFDLVYINPYTGKVVEKVNAKYEFFTVVLALHMNLLLGKVIGHFVVKWSVVCFVILLISGIILWWPKKWNRKKLKKNFAIKWGAKFKRLNYDLHNVAGFYASIVLLLISATGLMMSFELTADPQKSVSDTTQLNKAKFALKPADQIMKHASSSNPQSAFYYYNIPAVNTGTINVSAYKSTENFYQRVVNKYDQYSGKLLHAGSPFGELNTASQIRTINYDVHTGAVLGITGKFIAFIASLIAATLPVTGLIIWLGKSRKTKKKHYKQLSPSHNINEHFY